MSVAVTVVPTEDRPLAQARWRHDRGLLALVVLFLLLAPLVNQRIYASDEIQYFAYTHSLFFDADLDFSNEYLHFYNSDKVKFERIYEDLYKKRELLTNLPLNVAPVGTGLLWLPSFAAAHCLVLAANALGANIPADGYSRPYITAICLTSYLFGCLGLLLCYSLARRFFSMWVSASAVITVWLATPLVFYTVVAPPWSHATSLFTVTLFLWYWARTRRGTGRTYREWVMLGASAGLMMLVREQDALFLSVPGVEALAALSQLVRERSALLGRDIVKWAIGLLAMIVSALVMFIPQLIAYKVVTGAFSPSKIVSSKFTWSSPNFVSVLFSPEHGLFQWTPLALIALIGLFILWRHDCVLTGALAVALLLQVYVAGSFLTWQSAGSFGQRRFINSTSIFVLGACALTAFLLSKGISKWIPLAAAAVLVAWNGGLLMQYALWCSPQRQGLDWSLVLPGQLEMPGKAARLLWDYITNRERFYRSTPKC